MDNLPAPPAPVAAEGPDLPPLTRRYAPDAKDPKAERVWVEYAAPTGLSRGASLFTGLTESGDLGLVHAQTRCLEAALGEWLQEEPAGCAAGDAGLRRYVAAEPPSEE
jgi:hypothetical protein